MKKKTKGKFEWLEFDLFEPFPEVKHAIFLRKNSFDLGEKGTLANQLRALRLLDLKQGVKLVQSHGDRLFAVEKSQGMLEVKEDYDGLMTSQRGIGLMIRHADCQAALFYDPVHRALAAVHCGWRGNVHNIYQKTVATMKERYHSDPREVLVGIGPSLGPQAAEFKHYCDELPPHFWEYQVAPTYFDLWAISRKQLVEEGIQHEHIEIAEKCTYFSPKECFSYRREKETCGRHATIAALS